jgi:hypothetical protein
MRVLNEKGNQVLTVPSSLIWHIAFFGLFCTVYRILVIEHPWRVRKDF